VCRCRCRAGAEACGDTVAEKRVLVAAPRQRPGGPLHDTRTGDDLPTPELLAGQIELNPGAEKIPPVIAVTLTVRRPHLAEHEVVAEGDKGLRILTDRTVGNSTPREPQSLPAQSLPAQSLPAQSPPALGAYPISYPRGIGIWGARASTGLWITFPA
jgi:hypothetical protein